MKNKLWNTSFLAYSKIRDFYRNHLFDSKKQVAVDFQIFGRLFSGPASGQMLYEEPTKLLTYSFHKVLIRSIKHSLKITL